jgi:hypothetical protein
MPSEQKSLDEKMNEAIKTSSAEEVARLLAAGAKADSGTIQMAKDALRRASADQARLTQDVSPELPVEVILQFSTAGERDVINGVYVRAAEKVLRVLQSTNLTGRSVTDGGFSPRTHGRSAIAWGSNAIVQLGHPNADIRKQAILDTTARLGGHATKYLVPLLDDADEFVRVYAVRALGDMADDTVLPIIQDARTKASPDICFYYDGAIAAILARSSPQSPSNASIEAVANESVTSCGGTAHNWASDCERCATCGGRRDGAHDWSLDCESCSICGKQRSEAHIWSDCKCIRCGREHDWSEKQRSCSICGRAPADVLLNAAGEAEQIALVGSVKHRRALTEIVLSAADYKRISHRVRSLAALRISNKCEACGRPVSILPSQGSMSAWELGGLVGLCPSCETVMCLGCGGLMAAAMLANGKRSLEGKCPSCEVTLAP